MVWLILVLAVIALALLSFYNYRRFIPRQRSVGEETYAVEVQKLPVAMGTRTLYGEMLRPKGKNGALPTVICCHGFGATYKLCRKTMGMCLAKSGYQVYCFDFYGGSKRSRSGGSTLEMSVFTEREDLKAVIDALYENPLVDKERLYLLGGSQGGFICSITAPYRMDKVRAMILYYPAFSIPDDARKRYSSVNDIPAVSRIMWVNVGKVYSEGLLDYDVFDEIRRFTRPVLILHGEKDQIVDVSYAKKAAEVFPDAMLKIYPDEVHGFTAKGKLAAVKDSFEFIGTY